MKTVKEFAIMATLAISLAACSDGGTSTNSAVAPTQLVADFNIVPNQDKMTLSWTNPNRGDIESINLSWAAYSKNSISSRVESGDGYLFISNATKTAANVVNEYAISANSQIAIGDVSDGYERKGDPLRKDLAYVFSLQLSLYEVDTPATQKPNIISPEVPRTFGVDLDNDGFAEEQSYQVDRVEVIGGELKATLRWRNPKIGTGNIHSVLISYQDNGNVVDSATLNASEYVTGDGSPITYVWEGIAPGIYNFTITPVLDGIVANAITRSVVSEVSVFGISNIRFVNFPVFNPSTLPSNFDYENFPLTVRGSILSNTSGSDLVVSFRSNDRCSVTSNALTYPNFSAVVTPKKPGSCAVTVAATKGSARAEATIRISLPELVPGVMAQLVGSIGALPADQDRDIMVTVTKRDTSDTRDVIFPNIVASSNGLGCTGALVGDTVQQYNTLDIGSTVVVFYKMASNTLYDRDCGNFVFTATEGALTGRTALGGISFTSVDVDGDGIRSFIDVDDDGDGLIEIHSAAELNMLRNNIAGTGFSNIAGEQGSVMGCPTSVGCNGYELSADIDLASYTSWIPLGNSTTPFTSKFDGNSYTISGLSIAADSGDNQGLFGVIEGAIIRNVTLTDVSIAAVGSNQVGALVGDAQGMGTMIVDSSATGSSVTGKESVGGLVGRGNFVQILRSGATFDSISGSASSIGGLLGRGTLEDFQFIISGGARIYSSYTTIGSISGVNSVGGLVGTATNDRIINSVARVGVITATGEDIGGLLGYAPYAVINGSMAIVQSISGSSYAGGLVGQSENTKVIASAAIVHNITVSESIVAGLIGYPENSMINSSYASTTIISSTEMSSEGGLVGGSPPSPLLGGRQPSIVSDSYWDSSLIPASPPLSGMFPEEVGSGSAILKAHPDIGLFNHDDFKRWGRIYVNLASKEIETFYSPQEIPSSSTHTQAWGIINRDQYPLLNFLPISLEEQNTAINRVLGNLSPVPAR
ncbi:MAG: hypothetical protein K0U41_05840 [Gammaproteobacteria bacterium]|nr:hypothetical protein [Gammaproteobacteria bacterium]